MNVHEAYRILRPKGRARRDPHSYQSPGTRILNLNLMDEPFRIRIRLRIDRLRQVFWRLAVGAPTFLENKGHSFLETKEPGKFPIEFEGPARIIEPLVHAD